MDQPEKPGRDYGTKAHRQLPPLDQIDETHEAPLPYRCPDCSGWRWLWPCHRDPPRASLLNSWRSFTIDYPLILCADQMQPLYLEGIL